MSASVQRRGRWCPVRRFFVQLGCVDSAVGARCRLPFGSSGPAAREDQKSSCERAQPSAWIERDVREPERIGNRGVGHLPLVHVDRADDVRVLARGTQKAAFGDV